MEPPGLDRIRVEHAKIDRQGTILNERSLFPRLALSATCRSSGGTIQLPANANSIFSFLKAELNGVDPVERPMLDAPTGDDVRYPAPVEHPYPGDPRVGKLDRAFFLTPEDGELVAITMTREPVLDGLSSGAVGPDAESSGAFVATRTSSHLGAIPKTAIS